MDQPAPHPPFAAIAAMSLNRVIGDRGKIPWRLPEDFKWFKKMTTGQVIVMGRKTFESIGRVLPGRTTLVLSRGAFSHPNVRVAAHLSQVNWSDAEFAGRRIFICGGAEIYAQTLPLCSELYLTVVKRTVAGDAFFPAFEQDFTQEEEIADGMEFKILRYRRQTL